MIISELVSKLENNDISEAEVRSILDKNPWLLSRMTLTQLHVLEKTMKEQGVLGEDAKERRIKFLAISVVQETHPEHQEVRQLLKVKAPITMETELEV